jgi:hypothetical protein
VIPNMSESYRIAGGFHLIGNVFDVQVPLPLEIAPGLRFERPDEEQLKIIDRLISNMLPLHDARSDFECRWESGPIKGSMTRVRLPVTEWRYLLLTHGGNNISALHFLQAATVVEPTLFWLATAHTAEEFGRGHAIGWGVDSLGYHRQFFARQNAQDKTQILDQPAVDRMRSSYRALQALNRTDHPGIYRAVELFSLFNRLHLANFLDVLAMFMLIEMLLTHNPNEKEVGDSLNHQIVHKIPFVFERMGEAIDYSCFTKHVPERKIWALLYGYRSAVAHGNQPDFNSKLSALGDSTTADRFLAGITRTLLRHALDDPDLFEGLKPI